MLKKNQLLKKTKSDGEALISIMTTIEQEQLTNKEELWINIKTGVAQELAQKEAEKTEIKNPQRNDTLRTYGLPRHLQQKESRTIP